MNDDPGAKSMPGPANGNVPMPGHHSLTWLLDHTLPLNRKERFYTGTVLPGIVCADLAQLNRLTTLMGQPNVEVSSNPDDAGLVFFTEYGIAESAYGPAMPRFAGLSTARDTPDVVFLTTRPAPVLFALEAKMYDRPGGGALRAQLDVQRQLLEPLALRVATWLDVETVPVVQRALLPAAQSGLHLAPHEAITWEQIREAFRDVAPSYWLQMLTEALERYDDLVTRAVPNDDARMTGGDIVAGFDAGSYPYTAMGRQLGLEGVLLDADISSGAWREMSYQVAMQHPGNRNWFSIRAFVERIKQSQLSPSAKVLDMGSPGGASQPKIGVDGATFPSHPVDELYAALIRAREVGARVFGEGSVADAIAQAEAANLRRAPESELRRVTALYREATEAARVARESASELFRHVTEAP